jgi:hypothetical protein
MIKKTRSLWLLVVLGGLLATVLVAGAMSAPEQPTHEGVIYRGLLEVVNFDVSPRLDSLPAGEIKAQAFFEILDDRPSGLEGPFGPQDADGALQAFVGDGFIPSPSVTFNGPTNIFGVAPPDPVGDIGPSHYVAMSNLSYAVYSRTGVIFAGFPKANNTLWSGFGGDCETDNSGDPIVVYDQLVDRWILTQFTASGPTYFECVAVSTTGDPTGTYYRYAIATGTNFPDYPKVGVWSDAYYISTREFSSAGPFAGVGAYAMNKADVISGDPTPTIISFLAPPGGTPYNVGDGLLPADLDGTTLPPSSTTYFVGSMDNGGPYGAPSDNLTIWKFTPNWTTPASSTFALASTVPIAAYDTVFPCTPSSRACIPQPGTTNKIDILSYRQRPINRLAYRNFGSYESLVTNQSVDVSGIAGNRWWEIRSPGSSPVIYQEGTYAPGTTDGIHRWMASIAQDKDGNMALGFSASNATTTFPSVWYTGRLSTDPLGTMPQGEGVIVTGTGSQTGGGNRWGDYTSMNVDPLDDCTFWYVNEWVPTTSSSGWVLRIGAFKFPSCGAGGGTPTPTPTITSTPTKTPTPTATSTPGGETEIFLPIVANDAQIGGGGGGTPVEITHSSSQSIIPGNSVACSGDGGFTTTDNQYLRHFDLDAFGLTSGLDVTDVEFGVEAVNLAALSVTVNLYRWDGVSSFTYANFTLLGSETQSVGTGATGTIVSFPVTGSVPAGDFLVVEVKTPNTTGVSGFFIGSNTAAETAPSYLASTSCGLPNPLTFAGIGFPGVRIVMNVLGIDPALNSAVRLTLDGGSAYTGSAPAACLAAGPNAICRRGE